MRNTSPFQTPRKEPVLVVAPWDVDGEDDVPSKFQVRRWLEKLCEPDQLIAVWAKRNDGRNRGGFYMASRLTELVSDVMELSGDAIGVHWAINPVEPILLRRADHELRTGLGPPKDGEVLRRRFLPIDIDPKRATDASATDQEKQRAYDISMQVRRYLTKQGWPEPAFVDSGNGFYLLYRVDLPSDDAGTIKGVLRHLSKRFSNEHVEIDTSVANPGRVLKIPGTMACKGPDTHDRPHRFSRVLKMPAGGFKVVPSKHLESIAKPRVTEQQKHPSVLQESVPRQVVEQARSYIAKMPPAIAGEHGHDALFSVANRIVVDFNIPAKSEAARRLITEYNDRCEPVWSADDLQRKLDEADRLAAEHGEERGGRRSCVRSEVVAEFEPLSGSIFPFEVPDYALLPVDVVRAPVSQWKKVTPAMPLGTLLVMTSLRTDVRIPDVLLRDIYWGSHPPQAWRRALRSLHDQYAFKKYCRDGCPLTDTNIRHRHLVRPPGVEIDCLESFIGPTEDPDGHSNIAHRCYSRLGPNELAALQKRGKLYYFYLPAFLFARSKALGLTPQQSRCLLGITGELTRVAPKYDGEKGEGGKRFVRRHSPRVDRAKVIVGGYVLTSGKDSHRILCPMLDREKQYVVFGGNLGNRRGRGYSILRVHKYSWQQLVGFVGKEFESAPYDRIKSFFNDLEVLSDLFNLIPVGRHHVRGEWKSLSAMRDCLATGVGRDWLDEATLRIFAPEDYLTRWRYTIAKRLGFSWIPGAECPFASQGERRDESVVDDVVSLRRYLKQMGWTQSDLASKLEICRETVSRHLSGHRNSPEFWTRVSRLAAKTTVSE